jgi:hypothetical protein
LQRIFGAVEPVRAGVQVRASSDALFSNNGTGSSPKPTNCAPFSKRTNQSSNSRKQLSGKLAFPHPAELKSSRLIPSQLQVLSLNELRELITLLDELIDA